MALMRSNETLRPTASVVRRNGEHLLPSLQSALGIGFALAAPYLVLEELQHVHRAGRLSSFVWPAGRRLSACTSFCCCAGPNARAALGLEMAMELGWLTGCPVSAACPVTSWEPSSRAWWAES